MLTRFQLTLLITSPMLLALACAGADTHPELTQGSTTSEQEPTPTIVTPQVVHPTPVSSTVEVTSDSQSMVMEEAEEEPALNVTATLKSLRKTSIDVGKVVFVDEGDAIRISGNFERLPPGMHALKILDVSSCTALGRNVADFNPTAAKHGPIASAERHVGDLGNIKVSKAGVANFELTTDSLTVQPDGASSVLGRALVVTSRKDDGKTQPDGGSGSSISCGIIGNTQLQSMEASL